MRTSSNLLVRLANMLFVLGVGNGAHSMKFIKWPGVRSSSHRVRGIVSQREFHEPDVTQNAHLVRWSSTVREAECLDLFSQKVRYATLNTDRYFIFPTPCAHFTTLILFLNFIYSTVFTAFLYLIIYSFGSFKFLENC